MTGISKKNRVLCGTTIYIPLFSISTGTAATLETHINTTASTRFKLRDLEATISSMQTALNFEALNRHRP
jgi:hypothetical protein